VCVLPCRTSTPCTWKVMPSQYIYAHQISTQHQCTIQDYFWSYAGNSAGSTGGSKCTLLIDVNALPTAILPPRLLLHNLARRRGDALCDIRTARKHGRCGRDSPHDSEIHAKPRAATNCHSNKLGAAIQAEIYVFFIAANNTRTPGHPDDVVWPDLPGLVGPKKT